MKVTIFGTGYVGLVTGSCLADVGHHVVCVDIDEAKIAMLKGGDIPIYEPGLKDLVLKNQTAGRLEFTTDAHYAVNASTVQFIAVGTPPGEDGSADLKYVLAVAKTIGEEMESAKVVVTKSTVPVGTSDKVLRELQNALSDRGAEHAVDVASNPEFLKEGAAISDFMKPDRIVIGTCSDSALTVLNELYMPFNRSSDRVIAMDIRSAELTKYAANAMLATKISFINEIANLAEKLGADIEHVRHGIGSDPRIGYQFIYPGCGYGGSCFPKDVKALARTANEVGYTAELLNSVESVNEKQKRRVVDLIMHEYNGNVSGKVFAVWGLSFKPKTDDMREAPSRVILESLWAAGASVRAYDPEAMQEFQHIYGPREDIALCDNQSAALDGADALIICTEWQEFRAPEFDLLHSHLKDKVVFDGRNLFEPSLMESHGLKYYGIGRGASIQPAS